MQIFSDSKKLSLPRIGFKTEDFSFVYKPLLAQIAIHAITLDEYDDHFFNLMPGLYFRVLQTTSS
ncbi:hypothetical protein C8J55DRAFT_514767 [Lentinula edodes]|uniref:Uncharacterized protein n=1 Tax=Lentinula lateritia TaxID=40482 RepID=A0A9W9AB07_9AGAR|nr:hypothetical protein C8J55DRAFT_514767 [Lentinula edodes]